jgi:hypothetical protein
MDFELHPLIAIESGTFTVIIAPVEMITQALNTCPAIQRYLTLYICGNYSRILSDIHRTCTNFVIQRAFTSYQLLTVLQESHHTIIFLEHDPSLYEDDRKMLFPVAMALKEAARTADVICYAPVHDSSSRRLAKQADRVFYFEGTGRSAREAGHCLQKVRRKNSRGDQATLDAFKTDEGGTRSSLW